MSEYNLDDLQVHSRNDVWLGFVVGTKKFYHVPAVYFLYSGDVLLYIGQTGNLCRRIRGHCGKKQVRFNFVRFIHVKDKAERCRLEKEFIMRYPETQNKSLNPTYIRAALKKP